MRVRVRVGFFTTPRNVPTNVMSSLTQSPCFMPLSCCSRRLCGLESRGTVPVDFERVVAGFVEYVNSAITDVGVRSSPNDIQMTRCGWITPGRLSE